jgi:hypothetical protein
MASLTHAKPKRIPVPAIDECPAGCDLSRTLLCWLRRRRELRADLAAAPESHDAEVLCYDLRAAERRIDRRIEFGRWAA